MRKIKNYVSYFCIVSTVFLTLVAIFAIWVEDATDLLGKTALSISLMFVVSLVVLIASKYMHSDEELKMIESDETLELQALEIFKSIRKVTVAVLIGSSALLGFVGILSIWDILSDQDILIKVLSSLACIIFSAIVVIVVCILRSRKDTFSGTVEQTPVKEPSSGLSNFWRGIIIGFIVLLFIGFLADSGAI